MSRIQPLQKNSFGQTPQALNSKKKKSPTSFSGAFVEDLNSRQASKVSKALTGYVGRTKGWILDNLSLTTGEIQNLFVINLGTAFVAPIFIVHNPLSKEDKNSKKYTAWRQPISAIIALTFGLGINIPTPRLIENYLMKGKINKLDLSIQPPSSFTNRTYKKILKDFDKYQNDTEGKYKETKYLNYAKQDAENKGMEAAMTSAAEKAEATAKEEGKKLTKEEIAKIKEEAKTNYKFKGVNSLEDFKAEFNSMEMFGDAVRGTAARNYAETLLNGNKKKGIKSLKEITLKEYLIENLGFEEDHINKNILNPQHAKSKIEKLPADKFINAFGIESDAKKLSIFTSNYIEKDSGVASPVRKLISRFFGIRGIEDKVPSTKALLKAMNNLNHNLIWDEDEKHLKDCEDFLKMPMDEFLLKFNDTLDFEKAKNAAKEKTGNEIKAFEKLSRNKDEEKKALLKIVKGIAKFTSEKITSNYGAEKKTVGIVLSLLTLPFSCGLLNWAYPRVMEACFPKLAHSKADSANKTKGGK